MTQAEILHEFKQMTVRQQLEMLRTALDIIEANLADTRTNDNLPPREVVETPDPLLALAGQFESSVSDISGQHALHLGKSIGDDHA